MEFKEIQEIIKLVSKTNISSIKIKQGDFEIKIINKATESQPSAPIQLPVAAAPVAPAPIVVPVTPAPAPVTSPVAEVQVSPAPVEQSRSETVSDKDNTFIFRAPMIGTFYRKPSPDKEPFVKIGDIVKSGDVLCIIEAMKLFNEIEYDGDEARVIKVLVEDSSPVEYDQPLFLLEKLSS
ncbi:MAG: acetyl-CoA carboxylase biotin carboxyl carrier protein [Chitinophagales bacterium]|nr:acetyl-CoA carboxylase biotin carboxyl carrier protein [Chitinophagales bacterium]